ncbi:MAG: hypothetical protein HYV77_02725 [Candidatus Wildermuthbacteria bacterium]|nr:hypothetical protein [Candidatus Wildermuthbacteria bacterium]
MTAAIGSGIFFIAREESAVLAGYKENQIISWDFIQLSVENYFAKKREARLEAIKKETASRRPKTPIRAVYLTSYSASLEKKMDSIIGISKTTGINAVVIDIKDFSGYIAYDTKVPEAEMYNAERVRIKNVKSLLKKLHEANIYAIARITVFQDPVLARARPDLAVQSVSKDEPWLDNKGLAWMDPGSFEVWKYHAALAKDAAQQGFDEINFDYVRFPSDGDLKNMEISRWEFSLPRRQLMRQFFAYMSDNLPEAILSVDLFGLTATAGDDLGIGQVIEDAFGYFDYVSPMAYPSHYADGFLGFEEPALYPYEVIKHSLTAAQKRLEVFEAGEQSKARGRKTELRPWLQDFGIGGVPYTLDMVQAEIQAVNEVLGENGGYMMWNPSNVYTVDAFKLKPVSEKLAETD